MGLKAFVSISHQCESNIQTERERKRKNTKKL